MSKEEVLEPLGKSRFGCFYLLSFLMSVLGVVMFTAGFFTDSASRTADGYSLRYFFFIFGGIWALGWLLPVLLMFRIDSVRKKYREILLQQGQFGRAVVLKSEEVGNSEGSPVTVKLRLEIHLEGLAPYQVEEKAEIPILKLPQLQVGSTIEVLVAPAIPGVHMGAIKLIYK
jgi:hypothetical protein